MLIALAGFEPAHDGTKNRCLTTWLYRNLLSVGDLRHSTFNILPKIARKVNLFGRIFSANLDTRKAPRLSKSAALSSPISLLALFCFLLSLSSIFFQIVDLLFIVVDDGFDVLLATPAGIAEEQHS